MPDVADIVVCPPDDGWRRHPKHVEQFKDINKLCNFASFWIYIGIYLRCTDLWTSNQFDVHVIENPIKTLTIKPTRCTNYSNLFLE